jgi:hypothetical protein
MPKVIRHKLFARQPLKAFQHPIVKNVPGSDLLGDHVGSGLLEIKSLHYQFLLAVIMRSYG